jgi:hypothetical protein
LMNKYTVFLQSLHKRLYSDIFLFIFISTNYIVKFSICLCFKLFCLLGLPFASLSCMLPPPPNYSGSARVYCKSSGIWRRVVCRSPHKVLKQRTSYISLCLLWLLFTSADGGSASLRKCVSFYRTTHGSHPRKQVHFTVTAGRVPNPTHWRLFSFRAFKPLIGGGAHWDWWSKKEH